MRTIDRYIIFLSVAFIVSGVVFFLYPQIDLATTQLFYDAQTQTFPFKHTAVEHFLYHSVKYLLITIVVVFLILFYLKKISKKVLLYIFLTLSLAPGLIVNVVLKEHWGRARPVQTVDFGGKEVFQKPYVKTDKGYHSFSSGHAAAAFSVFGIALLARRKKLFITLALVYGSGVSFARVAAGGHYLSDVVTSFFIVTLVSLLLYRYFFKEEL